MEERGLFSGDQHQGQIFGNRQQEGDTERKEADQLFSKFAAYELAFAYLLF